jgi:hypothetical protein
VHPRLLDKLASELERSRELTPRVLNYISGSYGVDHDAIGTFLSNELSKLEEYEIDLILSPIFTPKLSDQAVFAEILGSQNVSSDELEELIHQLAARPTVAQLITPDDRSHRVTLHEVTIERYVRRLRLEGSISETVFKALHEASTSNPADRPQLFAIARRATLESEGARQILERYLTNAPVRGGYALDDAIDLLNLMETRKPTDLEDLLSRIGGWQKTLREQIDTGSGGKPFFNEDIRYMHGGGRDQRVGGDVQLSSKEREFEFLKRLERIVQ